MVKCMCLFVCLFVWIKPETLYFTPCVLYACMLGFCRTLEIIARTLREVVNRVRLYGHLVLYFPKPLVCLYAGILSHSGDHRAHSTQSGKQSEIVRSSHPKVFAR